MFRNLRQCFTKNLLRMKFSSRKRWYDTEKQSLLPTYYFLVIGGYFIAINRPVNRIEVVAKLTLTLHHRRNCSMKVN